MTTTADMTTATGSPAPTATTAEQRGAFGGLVFVVLVIASIALQGAPPAANASAAKIVRYLDDHATGIKTAQLVGALGTLALLWWFGSLWRTMSRAEGERPRLAAIAGAAFAVGVTLAFMSGTFAAAAALRVHALGDSTQALWVLSNVVLSMAGAALFVFLAATCVLNSRAAVFPRWTDYVGWLSAIAFLLGGAAGIVSDSNVGIIFNTIAPIVWCVWIAAVSISMVRRPRA